MTGYTASFYRLIGAFFFFLLLATGLEFYFNDTRLLNKHRHTIVSYLQEQEVAIDDLLKEEAFLTHYYDQEEDAPINYFEDINYPFNLCLYKNGKLIVWSNSIAFPDNEILYELDTTNPIFKKLSNGYYRIAKHSLPGRDATKEYAVSLIPIKRYYPAALKHLKSEFEPNNRDIPSYVEISDQPTDFDITDRAGNTICYLTKNQTANPSVIKDTDITSIILILYTIAFLLLGFIFNTIALRLTTTNKAWAGPAFLLFFVFGLRYLSIIFEWTERFSTLRIFQYSFSGVNISIGDLLINIVLLLWIVIFFHRQSRAKKISTNFPANFRFALATMNYFSLVLALLLLMSVFKSLILNSNFPFDFQNVFSLEPYSVAAVVGIILLLFTLFIFSHRMMLSVQKILLTRMSRVQALVLVTLVSIPIIHFIDLQIPLHFTALTAFIFLLAYDIFVDAENPGLIWIVVWIMFFTSCSSGLLHHFNYIKEIRNEQALAVALAESEDDYALKAIDNLNLSLTHQLANQQLPREKLLQTVESVFFKENYLYNNYNFSLFPAETERPLESADSLLNIYQAAFSQQKENIYSRTNPNGHHSYALDVSSIAGQPLMIKFDKSTPKLTTLYSEILSDKAFKNLEGLKQYDYAIYKNGRLVDGVGIDNSKVSVVFANQPPPKHYVRKKSGSKDDFLYNHDNHTFVLLSKQSSGYYHLVSLFSYIFTLLTLTILIFALINKKLRILPHNLSFNLGKKPSLKNRIQIATIILTLISFVVIAIISFIFLRSNWIEYNDNRLKRKVTSVQLDSEEWLHYSKNSIDFLKERIQRLAITHRIDVNLFDLDGNLISSSKNDIFEQGIIPPKMNANAIHKLGKLEDNYFQTTEHIGDKEFKTAFVSLKTTNGDKLAYLEVPYYNKHRSLGNEFSDFMGRLLNVYVFLLFMAGIFSMIIANSITRQLTIIREKMQEVKVGKPNTPIYLQTKDEIGSLVAEYNKMILKLDESAELLAKSEREGAWREMAKQVAHEIKNPLTPMKLSIQYLNHAYHSNPDNIDDLMERVSKTLIEQIDNLAHIASEFSNFAKMPRANNRQFVVNKLVNSVYDLFKKREDVDFSIYLPDASFTVFADKKQLMQVLNNLIKNAIEAIPNKRRGHIEVSLYERGGMAVIKVSDNGVGIPEEMRKKVFVPNFTTKNSGTGLGLAISKNIIESVNGKIYYETQSNIGTDFFVELPIEKTATLELV